jgi:hypothetical protein
MRHINARLRIGMQGDAHEDSRVRAHMEFITGRGNCMMHLVGRLLSAGAEERIMLYARYGYPALLLAGLAGCQHTDAQAPANGPPTVTVAHPLDKQIVDYAKYTGRTAAVDAVQVRARVSGYLQKIHFKDGADVNEGATLFEIDPRPYQAAYDQAEAQVNLQEANLKFQEAVYKRDVWLFGKQALAEQELQQQVEARNTASAQVKAAQAARETARLNLDWTAPSPGSSAASTASSTTSPRLTAGS